MNNALISAKQENNPSVVDSRSISEYFTDEFVLLSSEQIPESILERCALCFTDTLGVGIAAAGLNIGTAASRIAIRSGSGRSSIWGTGAHASAVEAALANGMLAHALDFDDTHAAAIMHTSCMVVPAALALGQELQLGGRDVLTAAVVGYEIAGLLGRLAPGAFQENGFQATAVLGVFAVTGMAARMMGLDREETVHAFGIAGSLASGLMEYLSNGSDVKQLHAGWSAQAGIRAAQFAAEGFTGPVTVFEGRFGVFRSFIRRDVSLNELVGNAEQGWEVERMGPKPYPACLCTHPLVQASLEIKAKMEADGYELDAIDRLHCLVPEWYVRLIFEPSSSKQLPTTPYEARFSGPYCIATALLDERLDLDSFTKDRLDDPSVKHLASLVTYEIRELPEFPDAFPAQVVAILSSGAEYRSYIRHNLGSPGNPLSPEQYEEKFRSVTCKWLREEEIRSLLDAIKGLVRSDDLSGYQNAMDDIKVQP